MALSWRTEVRALFAWRRVLNRLRAVLRSALTTFVVLTLTLWLMPGVASTDLLDILGLVVLVAVVGAVLRPLLLLGITALGGWGAMLLGVVAQVAVMVIALELDPAEQISGLPTLVAAAILAVVVAALLDWMADSGSDDTFVREARRLMRGVRRRAARRAGGPLITFRRPRPGAEPGLLMVQLDGVAEPVLRWAIRAGNLPTLGHWLRTGTHTMRGWHTGLPSTTPASQAGILHGASRQIPGFRWYEKETGKLMVSNRPRDAAIIETRLSDGRGLLRDGGVSISNAFSGDAATNLLTVSHAALPGRSARGWAAFMASPYGFTRALVLGVAEVLTELHQARLQRRRNLQPRVSRSGAFLALRPASMLLRDVNVSLMAEQMARGVPAIYCDLVDYDEVAHHAGPARPESMRQLESLDRMLGVLERLAPEAARQYHLVVLSDHGQSQGATFRQRYGETLDEVADRLAGSDRAAGPQMPAEEEGKVEPENTPPPATPLLVVSSGNLSMIYLTRFPHRLNRSAIDHVYPQLIDGLAAHPGIGLVVAQTEEGPVAYGTDGSHRLRDGTVTGTDPLLPYGPSACHDLLRHQSAAHVGDLVVISAVDPVTHEVAAFEELVGSHGGLGGWQTDAVLVHPSGWPTARELDGPDAVHRQLVGWLTMLGLRKPDKAVLGADPLHVEDLDPGRTARLSPSRDG
ncbi:putative phosphodiesterase/nucleotide pyrophosphatase [Actinoplanes missouriensis 431]|uniref:Putative phosphodiesterase/nucleotide pyrophosphatase n=1 Tax=Actinoplanes missouriensis (strain ATCC 14538 / DSM 43046 / CBS 188.64 / JCM 3121 / NBRC 102363 / NCIMB 12654 / NRRL B-3342 / UNCC 431) TaxID=512565 RepID=I0GY39_ACTM4|nr:alkaline phosphatase family protein [Actinoplanes missouriensis]BAL85676.1 putative phosphodiesterase/nucleotide pyrophosphatase [Actinoplanes missouriensis 431]